MPVGWGGLERSCWLDEWADNRGVEGKSTWLPRVNGGLRHNLWDKISRSPRETEGDLQWLKDNHHKAFSFAMSLRVEGW